MALLTRSLRAKSLVLLALVTMLILAACGSSTTGGSSGSSSSSTSSKVPVTVGSKLDPEAQLLGEMYVLLLRKAGFTVNSKLALGQTPTVFAALKSGSIDLYPEFTATGLNILGAKSAFDPAKDYQTVKNGFEQQYHITWLDQAPLSAPGGPAPAPSPGDSRRSRERRRSGWQTPWRHWLRARATRDRSSRPGASPRSAPHERMWALQP